MRDQLDRLVEEMLKKGILYDDARQAIERRFISRALTRSKGNLGQAADLLGIHRNTLTRKIASLILAIISSLLNGLTINSSKFSAGSNSDISSFWMIPNDGKVR